MQEVFTVLSDPKLGGALALFGLLASIASIVLFLHSRQKRRLTYLVETIKLIGHGQHLPANVTVLFDREPVKSLNRSNILIWNSGNATIRRDDIAKNDKLRIDLNNSSRIFSCEIDGFTRGANNFCVNSSDNKQQLFIDFDFADPADGAIISVIHDTDSIDPIFNGTLVGNRHPIIKSKKHDNDKASSIFIMIMAGGMSLLMMLVLWDIISNYSFEVSFKGIALPPLTLAFTSLLIFGFISNWLDFRKPRPPKSLLETR